jgi:hypothetical protein
MRVPVEKLRAEVEAAGLDAYELAAELGWRDRRGWVDSARVQRLLGERSYQRGGASSSAVRRGVNWTTAERVREAIRARTQPGHNTVAKNHKQEPTA